MMQKVSLLTDEQKLILEHDELLKKKISEFLDFLYSNRSNDNDFFEVRILYLNNKPARSAFFMVTETEKAAEYIIRMMKRDDNIKGIYVTVNPGIPPDEGAMRDENITEVINFVIDLDVFHMTPPAQNEVAEVSEAVKKAAEELFGKIGAAYLITFSGFGYHVFVKLKNMKLADEDELAAYKSVAKKTAKEFESLVLKHIDSKYAHLIKDSVDTSVYNKSRIMRVAYTINRRVIHDTLYETLSKVIYKSESTQSLDFTIDIENEIQKSSHTRERIQIENINNVQLTEDEKQKIVEAVKRFYVPGKRHHTVLGLAAFLYWRGVKLNDALEIVKRLHDETGDEDPWTDRERAVKDTYSESRYKNYKSYLTQDLIRELNRILSNYYTRATAKKKSAEDVTNFEEIRAGIFDLYEYLVEHTVDIIKEIDESKGSVTFKIVFFDDRTGREAQFIVKHISDDKRYKLFKALNNDFFVHFAHYIIDFDQLRKYDKETREKLLDYISMISKDYAQYLVSNAREIVIEEYADVRDEFMLYLEFAVKGIVRVANVQTLSSEVKKKILRKNYLLYDEATNTIYITQHMLTDALERSSAVRKLFKYFKKKKIVDAERLADVKTSFYDAENKKNINVYKLNAEAFLKVLEEEKVNIEIVDYSELDFITTADTAEDLEELLGGDAE